MLRHMKIMPLEARALFNSFSSLATL